MCGKQSWLLRKSAKSGYSYLLGIPYIAKPKSCKARAKFLSHAAAYSGCGAYGRRHDGSPNNSEI